MARTDYATCRRCGRHRDEVGMLSHTRLCGDCARVLVTLNMDGMYLSSDPDVVRRWRRAVAKSVGAVLLDEIDTAS